MNSKNTQHKHSILLAKSYKQDKELIKPTQLAHELVTYTAAQKTLTKKK